MMARSRSYENDLIEALKDPDEAREYLNAALEDGNDAVFLLALRDVAQAQLKTAKLAKKNTSNWETLSEALSENNNSTLAKIQSILSSLGYQLAVEKNIHSQVNSF